MKGLTHRIVVPARVGSIPTYRPRLGILFYLAGPIRLDRRLWWYSQVVRQRSAKPLSSVRIRLPPLTGCIQSLVIFCRSGGTGRRAGLKIQCPLRTCGFEPHLRYIKEIYVCLKREGTLLYQRSFSFFVFIKSYSYILIQVSATEVLFF